MIAEVWGFRNQKFVGSGTTDGSEHREPKFGGFGTMWITLPQNTNGLRAIFGLVTYSVGNEVNTRAAPLRLAYVESA